MSSTQRGFVSDARFARPGDQVIQRTNRQTTRKWRALGVPDVAARFAVAGICDQCGQAICNCGDCQRFKGDNRCWEHRKAGITA